MKNFLLLLFLTLTSHFVWAQTTCSGNVPIQNLANGMNYTITVGPVAGNVAISLTVVDNPAGLVGFLGGPGNPISFPNAMGTFTYNLTGQATPYVLNMFFNWAAGGQGSSTAVSCPATPPPPANTDITFCVDVSCLPAVTSVNIFGTFNGWCAGCNPLTDPNNDGIYCGTISFSTPGVKEYKFLVNGVEESFTPGAPCTVTNFGFTNRAITVVAGVPQTVTFGFQSCGTTCVPPPGKPALKITFENPPATTNYNLVDFAGATSSIITDPTNAANKVVRVIKNNGAATFAGTVLGNAGLASAIPFTAAEQTMTVRVWAPAAGIPVLLKIERTTGGPTAEVLATTTTAGWQTLAFNFSTSTNQPWSLANTYDKIVIFFAFGSVGTGQTFYLDDVAFCDSVLPVITCPANVTVACTASTLPAATGTATATDVCDVPVVTFTDVSTQGQGCSQYSYIIIRTWKATDACGNTATCSQTITVQDLVAPTIACPANVTRQCDQPTDPGSTGNATATGDNCATLPQISVTFTDVSSQTAAGCTNDSYVITRTWRATDPCGNFSTCVQTITVVDNTPPTIICPANTTIQCTTSTAPGATGTATGNAAANSVSWPDASTGLVGTSTANVSGIPAGAVITDVNVVLRMDHSWVGDLNMTLVSPSGATVNFMDNPCAGGNSDNINATFDSQGAAFLCTNGIIADVGNPNDCGSDYLIGSAINGTRQTQLNNFNGFNGSTMGNGNWQLQITDEVGGDGGCLIAYSVQVTWQTLGGGAVGAATAVDNCSPLSEIAITFTDVSTQTAAACGNDNYMITRTWRATDACGNFSTCVQTINVVDTTPPTITCPANVSIACTASTAPAATGTATATDGCSATVTITSTDVSTQTAAGCSNDSYQIFRTWRATDACGNFSTCLQTITVSDTQAPVITCPPGQTLTCFQTVPAPFTTAAAFIAGGGTITDNCTTNLADFTVFVQNVDNGNDNCPGNARVVTRTYFVQDACLNTTSCTQTFTYIASTQGPVITSVLPTCFKFCASLANPMESDITYTTDCSFGAVVNITGPQQIGATNCPGTIYRYTYTVTDDCGRTSAPVTRDFIIGNDGPTITCPPFNLFLECGDENNAQYLEDHFGTVLVNTSCELGYTLTYSPQNFNNIACGSSTIVTFTATDACGRTSTCSTTVAIMDNTAPTIVSVPPSVCDITNCSADEVFWFNHWKNYMINGIVATDACDSDVNVTAVNTPLNTNCPNGTAVTVVTFVATDNCGNETEITGTFTVEATPSNMSILGKVATEVQEAVESVEVTLAGSNIANQMMETGVDGLYGFNGLLAGDNYSVTPYSNDNPLNGVSSYDLVLISKHILQTQLLDSPYKMIAADINRSGSITTMDMVALRKLILHVDEEFANNTSWRFVEAAFVFPQPNNPFATLFPEAVFINGLTESEEHDFVGVKVGDVNGSAVPNAFAATDDRTFVDDLVFQVKDQELKAGQTYEVAFRAENFEAVHGYQFTLNFDKQALTFAGLRAGDLTNMTESNFGTSLLNQGAITTSWTNQTAQSLTRDAAVFYVSFTANVDVLLSEAIAVSSRYTKAEAYDANLDLMDVKVRFNESATAANGIRLYQNTPNPFVQETVIGFDLPEAMGITLTIYDGSGRLLKQIEGDFAKGYNAVSFSKEDLSPGLLHYQLVTEAGTATRKMLLQGN
jgi:subtilisin-like proprotein convertase family protein